MAPQPDPLPEKRKSFLLAALQRYEQPLTAYAARLFSGDLDRARDAVQHSFLKLCQQPPDTVDHKLAAWLYTVCRNRIVDELRARRSDNASLDQDCRDPNSPDPADRAEKLEFLRCLRSLINRLPEIQREVIDLWSHGFSSVEIAEILDKQTGAVRVCLHRGLKQLRQEPQVAAWLERATSPTGSAPATSPHDRITAHSSSSASRLSGDSSESLDSANTNGHNHRTSFVSRKSP